MHLYQSAAHEGEERMKQALLPCMDRGISSSYKLGWLHGVQLLSTIVRGACFHSSMEYPTRDSKSSDERRFEIDLAEGYLLILEATSDASRPVKS